MLMLSFIEKFPIEIRFAMSKDTKPFDCVEMKHKAQRKLRAEYESRKNEFASYFAFLDAKARESDWQREFWAKLEAPCEANG